MADELAGAGVVEALAKVHALELALGERHEAVRVRSTLSPVSPDASEKKSPCSSPRRSGLVGLHLLALHQETILGTGWAPGGWAATVLGQGASARRLGQGAAGADGCSSLGGVGSGQIRPTHVLEGDLG
jgi:hypothetical protein